MVAWIIYSEDREQLGRSAAIQARTAFFIWHERPPDRLADLNMSLLPDGSYRVECKGKVYILRNESDLGKPDQERMVQVTAASG